MGLGCQTLRIKAIKVPYDPLADFTAVCPLATSDYLLLASPRLQAKTFADFLRLARSQPGKLNFGTHGVGGLSHLAAELLSAMAGIRMEMVQYKAKGPAPRSPRSWVERWTFIRCASYNSAVRERGHAVGIGHQRYPTAQTITADTYDLQRRHAWLRRDHLVRPAWSRPVARRHGGPHTNRCGSGASTARGTGALGRPRRSAFWGHFCRVQEVMERDQTK